MFRISFWVEPDLDTNKQFNYVIVFITHMVEYIPTDDTILHVVQHRNYVFIAVYNRLWRNCLNIDYNFYHYDVIAYTDSNLVYVPYFYDFPNRNIYAEHHQTQWPMYNFYLRDV